MTFASHVQFVRKMFPSELDIYSNDHIKGHK